MENIFGIRGPENVQAWWGARAIYHPNDPMPIDFVWDRTSKRGVNGELLKLTTWLDKTGLKFLQTEVHKAHLGANEDRELRLKKDGYVLVINPKRSYGYLHIGVWKE